MPAGPGGKDVVEFLAHDSSHRPAEAGGVVAVEGARRFDHEASIPRRSRKINRCADVGCSLEASTACLTPHQRDQPSAAEQDEDREPVDDRAADGEQDQHQLISQMYRT